MNGISRRWPVPTQVGKFLKYKTSRFLGISERKTVPLKRLAKDKLRTKSKQQLFESLEFMSSDVAEKWWLHAVDMSLTE
ncbi:hypothetical protein RRG08_018607 [Elysia crispata]|uniref:Uncharacterized protein n=1 Tax=Elysia crispata TaxID=231223 RepID=A0AAE1E8Z2_9GAST|nr:hypothetical protein RRG08_018607 [Elysia crispata]